ncbi:MAG: ABC transporter substrate-binding protein [Acidobacteriota bacterium]
MKRALTLPVLLFLCACGVTDKTSSTRKDDCPPPPGRLTIESSGKQGGTLHYTLPGDPSSFNFAMAANTRTRLVTSLTTATLLEFDPQAQRVKGGITEEWTVSDDARKVTLTLRQGVRFSDGRPLSSRDVVFTFQKIYEPGSKNPLRNSLMVAGKPLEARALNERSVEVRFPKPYAAAEYILTTIPVLPEHRFQAGEKKIEDYWNLETRPEEMAGLGPFVVAEHLPGQLTRFRYNPQYWKFDEKGTRLPYLDEIVIHYIEDRNGQLLRFQAGELDLLGSQLRPEDYLQLRGEDGIRVFDAGPSSALTFFWLNLNTGNDPKTGNPYVPAEKRNWFSDLTFRRAVDTAISRDTIVKNVFLGKARAAWALVPSSIPAWYVDEIQRYPHDPGRARQLLKQAGFSWKREGGQEFLVDRKGRRVEFEILTRADKVFGKIAAVLQQDLEKVGMHVSIKQEELRSVISRITRSRNYDSALLSLDFPYDPADHVNVLLSSSPMHFWNPSQPTPVSSWEKRIDELALKQVTTLNLQDRQRIYGEVQKILAEKVPIVPLVNGSVLIAAKSRVNNLKPVNLFPFALWNVWELWLTP